MLRQALAYKVAPKWALLARAHVSATCNLLMSCLAGKSHNQRPIEQ